MHIIYKLSLVFAICSMVHSEIPEETFKCNLDYCGKQLLIFDEFSFHKLFRKIEVANFCIKNCTPPVVHEFYQSIIYGLSKKIPGLCRGDDCIDENRFVALTKCVEDQGWFLLQCSKRLIDLAHIRLVKNPIEDKRNTTCRIVTETVQCIEETLRKCGEGPFQLVKEILGHLIHVGVNAYCHPSYRNQGLFIKKTTAITEAPDGLSHSVTDDVTGATYKHPQYVKGYRQDNAAGLPSLSNFCLLFCVILSTVILFRRP